MNSPVRPRTAAIVSANVGMRVPANFAIEPRAGVQAADFGQREVGQRPLPSRLALDDHLTAAVGEDLLDVGRPLERRVVQDHQRAVLGALQVELHERRVLLGGQHERGHGVLGCVRRRTAMPHHPGRGWWARRVRHRQHACNDRHQYRQKSCPACPSLCRMDHAAIVAHAPMSRPAPLNTGDAFMLLRS